jgi:hypothetical protein
VKYPDLVLCELTDAGEPRLESHSPFCLKVHRALELCRFSYERRHAARPDAYRHYNPLAQVPVLLVDGEPVRLTRREFELLRYLVQNKNRVVSRDRLLERVWGYDRLVETRSVDVHVGRLRGKLREAGRQIETVVGLGYRFID